MLVIATILMMFFQTAETLAPVVVPLVILGLTVAITYGLKLNGSRTITTIGAVATAYAALGPQISNYATMPVWLRVALIVLGIGATTLNERLQGGKSTVTGEGTVSGRY